MLLYHYKIITCLFPGVSKASYFSPRSRIQGPSVGGLSFLLEWQGGQDLMTGQLAKVMFFELG